MGRIAPPAPDVIVCASGTIAHLYRRHLTVGPLHVGWVFRGEDALKLRSLGAGAVVHIVGDPPPGVLAELRARERRGVRLVWVPVPWDE